MSKSGSIANWAAAVAVAGLGAACSFQASVSAGGGASSPEEPPATETAPPEAASPEPAPVEAPAAPKANVKVNGAKLIVPGDIVFQADSSTLAAGNEAVLAEVKTYLDQNPRVTRLRIEGHTNNVRPEEQSLELSGHRARAVKLWLRDNGIHEGRLLAVGFGDTQPVASNADAAGQAQNERIAFRIAELDGKPYLGPDPLAGGTEFP